MNNNIFNTKNREILIYANEETHVVSKAYSSIKRLIDVIGALIAIILLLPLFIIIPILIKLESRGPVIFKQTRMGKNNEKFYIYKFRSMLMESPNKSTQDFKDSHLYITRIGNFIRKTSIDEIPQFLNILKGDMSIVGPRPVIEEERDLINLRNIYNINSVKPGVTGWAQVNGRDNVSIEEKVKLDYFYYKNRNVKLDMKIMIMTIVKVLKRDDIR